MVTSTKAADDRVVTMNADAGAGIVGGVPPRTLLEDVNAHLTCVLCRGYYIDATTIVECLHSFCRSCIVKHLQTKKYCPVCEMMINAAKPNIKPDKALQDIVYKLVPGLFQREMERRRQFYSSRPGPAATATPEQRGEDTERIIFSPEDVISFSLEYAELNDTDSVSSRSSESGNEAPSAAQQTRRYLQCPAVVNISHLKKFISMKFDIDCSQFCIDILYKRVPLLDYYTLMDIAYIYNWKRNEPMRFFYQIIDYSAIRSRFGLFDIKRKGSQFRDRKPSPASTEDTNADSPAPPQDNSSEGTSGTNSPMPGDYNNSTSSKVLDKTTKKIDQVLKNCSDDVKNCSKDDSPSTPTQEVDVEKSQFLNSFELTAKNSSGSPSKLETGLINENFEATNKDLVKSPKSSSPQVVHKRKTTLSPDASELKKVKSEVPTCSNVNILESSIIQGRMTNQTHNITKSDDTQKKSIDQAMTSSMLNRFVGPNSTSSSKSINQPHKPVANLVDTSRVNPKILQADQSLKRTYPSPHNSTSPKRKFASESLSTTQNCVPSPQVVKPFMQPDHKNTTTKINDPSKTLKKLPELKFNIPNTGISKLKSQTTMNRGIRSDLLANNSDPIPDRSKILSQVKRSLTNQCPGDKPPVTGDPLKSLFDSCKINIPSSLSITLTDQKLEPRNDSNNTNDSSKASNKNGSQNASGNFASMKSPTPAVQNSIEILKLPDVEPSKTLKSEASSTSTPQTAKSIDPSTPTTSKGPVPSLKPISDTKIGKQSTFSKSSPTFHQIFIQSLQPQQPEKSKPKNKAPVPKLMPANTKPINDSIRNESQSNLKTHVENATNSRKNDSVLDLSTPSQLGPHQTKLLETMQSIANLAKKQNFVSKPNVQTSLPSYQHAINKPTNALSVPPRTAQTNLNKLKTNNSPSPCASGLASRIDNLQSSKPGIYKQTSHLNPNSHNSTSQQIVNVAQSSPRSQTRSPSASPKLVIAEDKQTPCNSDANQSNQISSSQNTNTHLNKTESGAQSPSGPLKAAKLMKPQPLQSTLRMPSPSNKPSPSSHPGAEMLHSLAPQILAQQQALQQCLQARQQFEMQTMGHILPSAEWINKLNQARHIENLYKSLSNAQQSQNEFNTKENKK